MTLYANREARSLNGRHERTPAPPGLPLLLVLALLVTALAPLPLAAAEAGGGEEVDPRATFSDRIDVTLVTFDVRVVDGLGRPIRGLGRDDLRVRLGGEPAPVLAMDWVPGPAGAVSGGAEGAGDAAAGETERRPTEADAPTPTAQPPQRVVFFLQAGLIPSKAIGHLRLLPRLREMVQALPPEVPAAVASFHSHLTLHQDFTTDRERLAAALALGRGYHHGELPDPPDHGPSLARHLDPDALRRVAQPAPALTLVARALAAEPGPASIVYVGWSLERLGHERATLVRTLVSARIPLFVLDVTDADFHTLEGQLRVAAWRTGGSYSNTRHFPHREVARVRHLVTGGRYRLSVRRPHLPAGPHPLRVTVTGRGYRRVLAPRALVLGEAVEGSPVR